MAGRIGSVQKAQDGQTYGFVLYDAQDCPCMYIGFSTRRDADRAARGGAGTAGGGGGLRAAVACGDRGTVSTAQREQ